jgi:hypothetical protein
MRSEVCHRGARFSPPEIRPYGLFKFKQTIEGLKRQEDWQSNRVDLWTKGHSRLV